MVTKQQTGVRKLTYVEYQHLKYQNSDVSNLIIHIAKIGSRNITQILDNLAECTVKSNPALTNTVRFRFFDMLESDYPLSNVVYKGEPNNYSGWYYLGGREMTWEEVKKEIPNKESMIKAMEEHMPARIVFTRTGHLYMLNNEDKILLDPLETLLR